MSSSTLRPFNKVVCPRCNRTGYVVVHRRSSLTNEIASLKVVHDDGKVCKFGRHDPNFENLLYVYCEAVRISKTIREIERAFREVGKIDPNVWRLRL